jgi:epoxide hydrolase-like predicted phosphatase
MKIHAVVWDLGGVIVRTEDVGPRQALAARYGHTRESLDELVFGGEMGTRAQLGEIDPQELWAWVAETLNAPPEVIPEIEGAFWLGDVLDKSLVSYIRGLKTSYRVGLLSNAWTNLRSLLQDHWKIDDAFHKIVISGEERIMKPDRRIYQKVIDQLAVSPTEAVFIDDFSRNIAGAQAIGMQGIHFRSPKQALHDLEELLGQKG